MPDNRNNSWDAFWSDARKGAAAIALPLLLIVLLVFGFKAVLITLAVVAFLWIFVFN